MRPEIEKELIKKALDIFHGVQKDIEPNDFNQQVKQLYEFIEKRKLHELITIEDLKWAIKDDMFFRWDTTIYTVSDDRFVERFKSTMLTTKTYDFYVPIYCLYEFPKNMKLANSIVMDFQDLPNVIQDYFILKWQHRFSIDTEYHHGKDEYVNLKKKTTFIHFIVECNGANKALEKAMDIAEDALHIIRFAYQINFNLIDIKYVIRENGNSGGMEDVAGLPFCGGADYDELWGKSIKTLTKIFLITNPNDLENRFKNAIRIFGTQISITNRQVRFLLLMTCLESLLMSKSDTDYILWRLAEKTAFLLGRNKRCLLYTSDAADDSLRVDLGGRRIIKKRFF